MQNIMSETNIETVNFLYNVVQIDWFVFNELLSIFGKIFVKNFVLKQEVRLLVLFLSPENNKEHL